LSVSIKLAVILPSFSWLTAEAGTGPSALILSYLLHGNIPYYAGGHHDAILRAKLERQPCLLRLTPDLYEHFYSSLRYSTQALPINTLLDTLLRPNADTEASCTSTVQWRYEPERAIPHIILGNSLRAGGQWACNTVPTSSEIGTLSYADMLSLPGYSYAEHYMAQNGKALPEFIRPSRREVADYYAAYPAMVGISDVIHLSEQVSGIDRMRNKFIIGSHGITCRHLVLATGTSSINLRPPPFLAPLESVCKASEPLLVIGSGFSAADIILSAPPNRKIVHIYRWSPKDKPSPLKNCHYQAYPEYAAVYRQMRLAATRRPDSNLASTPSTRRRSSIALVMRDWANVYQGLPNAEVVEVLSREGGSLARIRTTTGQIIETRVGELAYVVGRRSTLNYLAPSLHTEILGDLLESPLQSTGPLISGRTLRSKAEIDTEIGPNIFITGSLTGDSLVRHAFGACAYAAGRIEAAAKRRPCSFCGEQDGKNSRPSSTPSSGNSTPYSMSPASRATINNHEDLHLDRRKFVRSSERKSED